MFIIEDYPLQNPYYHSPNDTLDTLNLGFHTDVTRSLVAAIASLGGAFSSQDIDNDGLLNEEDNCPTTPNSLLLGTCVKLVNDVVVGMGTTCNSDGDCVTAQGETCDKLQGDINSNGCGDACECYADISSLDQGVPDGNVDIQDLILMKQEYGRNDCDTNPCLTDLNEDNTVNIFDLVIIKIQYLRTGCPC